MIVIDSQCLIERPEGIIDILLPRIPVPLLGDSEKGVVHEVKPCNPLPVIGGYIIGTQFGRAMEQLPGLLESLSAPGIVGTIECLDPLCDDRVCGNLFFTGSETQGATDAHKNSKAGYRIHQNLPGDDGGARSLNGKPRQPARVDL
jgi:hypothetical protein